jgi:hypothetical protein
MLRLIPSNVQVPDGYRFKVPNDGIEIIANNYDGWLEKIRKHYIDNGYELPADWIAQAEEQLCKLLPPGWCRYDDGSAPKNFIDRRFTFDDALNGTKVLIEFVKQGAPLVSQEEAEERGRTCAACYAALPIPGCSSCRAFANYVAEVAGARKTKSDAILDSKSCGVCKCSAIANLWIPVEVSQKGVTEEMMALWPEHCWKGQQIRALRAKAEPTLA